MGDQLPEVERHFGARVTHAHLAAIPGALHREAGPALVPGIPQLIQRHRHRAEGGRRFALEKAETLGQLVGNQVAQAHVVGQHDQANAVQCTLGCAAHGNVAGDDSQFGLEIDAIGLICAHNVVAGADEIITAALVHQRLGVVVGGHFGIAGHAHQLHVVNVGRPIRPLVGARQRCHAHLGVKRKGVAGLALIQRVIQILQLWRHEVPVIQHLLQLGGDAGRIMRGGQVTRDDDELAVA